MALIPNKFVYKLSNSDNIEDVVNNLNVAIKKLDESEIQSSNNVSDAQLINSDYDIMKTKELEGALNEYHSKSNSNQFQIQHWHAPKLQFLLNQDYLSNSDIFTEMLMCTQYLDEFKDNISFIKATVYQNTMLQKKIKQLEKSLTKYQTSASYNKTFQIKVFFLNEVVKDRDRLADRIENMRPTNNEIRHLKTKAQKMEEMEHQLQNADRNIRSSTIEIENLKETYGRSELDLLKQKIEINRLKSKIVCMQHETETLKYMCKDNDYLQVENKRLNNQLNQIVSIQDGLQNAYKISLQNASLLQMEKDMYKKQCENITSLYYDLKNQLKHIDRLEQEKYELLKQIDQLVKRNSAQEEEITKLLECVEYITKREDEAEINIKEVISIMKEEINEKHNLLTTYKYTLDNLKQRITNLIRHIFQQRELVNSKQLLENGTYHGNQLQKNNKTSDSQLLLNNSNLNNEKIVEIESDAFTQLLDDIKSEKVVELENDTFSQLPDDAKSEITAHKSIDKVKELHTCRGKCSKIPMKETTIPTNEPTAIKHICKGRCSKPPAKEEIKSIHPKEASITDIEPKVPELKKRPDESKELPEIKSPDRDTTAVIITDKEKEDLVSTVSPIKLKESLVEHSDEPKELPHIEIKSPDKNTAGVITTDEEEEEDSVSSISSIRPKESLVESLHENLDTEIESSDLVSKTKKSFVDGEETGSVAPELETPMTDIDQEETIRSDLTELTRISDLPISDFLHTDVTKLEEFQETDDLKRIDAEEVSLMQEPVEIPEAEELFGEVSIPEVLENKVQFQHVQTQTDPIEEPESKREDGPKQEKIKTPEVQLQHIETQTDPVKEPEDKVDNEKIDLQKQLADMQHQLELKNQELQHKPSVTTKATETDEYESNDLEHKIKELQEKNLNLQKEFDQSIDNLKKDNEKLAQQLSESQKQYEEFENKSKETPKEKEASEKVETKPETQIHDETQTDPIKELESNVDTEKIELQSKLADLQQQLDEKNKQLEQKHEVATKATETDKYEDEDLKRKINELLEKNANLQKEYDQSVKDLKKDNEALNQQLSELQKNHETPKDTVKEAPADVAKIEEATPKPAETEVELKDIQIQTDPVKAPEELVDNEKVDLQKKLEDLQQQLEQKNQEFQQKALATTEAMEAYKKESDDLKRKLDEQLEQNTGLQKELDQSVKDLKKDNKRQVEQLSESQKNYEKLKEGPAEVSKQEKVVKPGIHVEVQTDVIKEPKIKDDKEKIELQKKLDNLQKELDHKNLEYQEKLAAATKPKTDKHESEDFKRKFNELLEQNKDLQNKFDQSIKNLKKDNEKLVGQLSESQKNYEMLQDTVKKGPPESPSSTEEKSEKVTRPKRKAPLKKETKSEVQLKHTQTQTDPVKEPEIKDDQEKLDLQRKLNNIQKQLKQKNEQIDRLQGQYNAIKDQKPTTTTDQPSDQTEENLKLKNMLQSLNDELAKCKKRLVGKSDELKKTEMEKSDLENRAKLSSSVEKVDESEKFESNILPIKNVNEIDTSDYIDKINDLESTLIQFDNDIKTFLNTNKENIDKLQKLHSENVKNIQLENGIEESESQIGDIKEIVDLTDEVSVQNEKFLKDEESIDNQPNETCKCLSEFPNATSISIPLIQKICLWQTRKQCPHAANILFHILMRAAVNGMQDLNMDELEIIHKTIGNEAVSILRKLKNKLGADHYKKLDVILSVLKRIDILEENLIRKYEKAKESGM